MSSSLTDRGPPLTSPAAVHPVDEILPAPRLFVLGLQHVLAMYAGAVAVPLLVGSALKLTPEQIIYLINADLLVSGIASFIQAVGIGPIGVRLPLIQGVTFTAVTPMILIGQQYGVTAIYGAVIVSGIVTMLASPLFSRLLRFFPPLVMGTVIATIGITLMPVAVL
jgi:xanthine/uracil permease